ncbi:MAG: tRNA (N(6)-L-threonylcarbamoyladenosine(37)-C(2))-methylthiotransferase MtaB [Treponema sp.]|nr:tRNA (N(6)-L-threonylcarbamoyladenosine(37)-C(2))-methylthiotransferase MtaB [Treponema sp.]
MLSVSFYTLGCKLNQLETEALSESFRDEGFAIVPWIFCKDSSPEVCVINTCTVTSKAEQKARRIIRFCLKKGCIVLVTGCYAQLEKKAIKALSNPKEEDLFVIPGQAKDKILDLPRFLSDSFRKGVSISESLKHWPLYSRSDPDIMKDPDPFRFKPRRFSYHSRAFLKIQDGCDGSCTYCRVPLARGKSISLDSTELLQRLKTLEDDGMAEAVITGVNICQYRDPSGKALSLAALLKYLLDNTARIAMRLSSLEPEFFFSGQDIDENGILEILAHKRIRNHFHLSVQSGSDSVLSAMGRSYRAWQVSRAAEILRINRNDPFLACDIITGFPGETEDDFGKTLQLCRDIDFAWIHAFPFSKRPGTYAAGIKKALVSQRIAGERLNILAEISRQGRHAYIDRWLGRITEAVVESSADSPDAFFFPALTDNYLKVLIPECQDGKPLPGTAIHCRIGKPTEGINVPDNFDTWAEYIT